MIGIPDSFLYFRQLRVPKERLEGMEREERTLYFRDN